MRPLVPSGSDAGANLLLALVASSSVPLLLLDGDLRIVATSDSFHSAFEIDPSRTMGRPLSELGGGEWGRPHLAALLRATASGFADIPAYEMDLTRPSRMLRSVVLTAHKLDYGSGAATRLMLTIADVTDFRAGVLLRDSLLREKTVLLDELQHRIANSLQIISSILLQSARAVQSEEARSYLAQAHNRVRSVTEVQRHLADTQQGIVALRPYFTTLCRSISESMIPDPGQLSLSLTVDDGLANGTRSVSLGLIITELVMNAIKHAFPGERSGNIWINYHSNDADWVLSVGDDGVGMSSHGKGRRRGLGTSIVEALAGQLNAEVAVTGEQGTLVSVGTFSRASIRPALRVL